MFQHMKQSTYFPQPKIAQSSLWTERRKLSQKDEWLVPLGRWLICGPGPEAQVSAQLMNVRNEVHLTPTFPSGVTPTPTPTLVYATSQVFGSTKEM